MAAWREHDGVLLHPRWLGRTDSPPNGIWLNEYVRLI